MSAPRLYKFALSSGRHVVVTGDSWYGARALAAVELRCDPQDLVEQPMNGSAT